VNEAARAFLARYEGIDVPEWETAADLSRMGVESMARQEAEATARWVTLPGDDWQHTSGGNCPCQPVQHPSGAWDHQ
jgi:hypothetical protein